MNRIVTWFSPAGQRPWRASALAVTGLGGMLAVIAGRVREMYADAASATSREASRAAGTQAGKEMPDS